MNENKTVNASNKKTNPEKTDPVIGIAFGGGGIRGFAHLAILEKFKEYNIKPDMVSGTSIGSGIAVLCAAGCYGEDYTEKIFQTDFKSLFSIGSKGGFISGKKYAKAFVEMAGAKTFEELPIPVKIVATDLVHWDRVVFDKGPLMVAIQASSAVPGAFTPVKYGDKLLVDGCVVDNCPADILKQMGADIVIAIDLDYRVYDRPKNVKEVVQRSMDIMASNGRRAENADYIIKPFDSHVPSLALNKADFCYDCGKEVIEAKMPEILALLRAWYEERDLPCPLEYQESYLRY